MSQLGELLRDNLFASVLGIVSVFLGIVSVVLALLALRDGISRLLSIIKGLAKTRISISLLSLLLLLLLSILFLASLIWGLVH